MALYIVATPIGNLEDLTFRALETLKACTKIYCEDTRRTRTLLNRFNLDTPLESFHQHSDEKLGRIIRELNEGAELAYVSDAGTPGIQDPGGKLVAAARAAGIKIVPIPGASAITALLSVAGIPTDQFFFAGYVPTKKGRETFIKKIIARQEPTVFFETAPRLHKFFDQLTALGGESRQLIVGRELTKQFEEIQTGTPDELKSYFTAPRGEFVLVLTPENGA